MSLSMYLIIIEKLQLTADFHHILINVFYWLFHSDFTTPSDWLTSSSFPTPLEFDVSNSQSYLLTFNSLTESYTSTTKLLVFIFFALCAFILYRKLHHNTPTPKQDNVIDTEVEDTYLESIEEQEPL